MLVENLRGGLEGRSEAELRALVTKESNTQIFSLAVFTPGFMTQFVEELEHFERSGLPVSRPNSMNNYGMILHDLGFSPLMDVLVTRYLAPLARVLYPQDAAAQLLDSHHSFTVEYRLGQDVDLGFHYDDSDVTLNVCLGKEFTGGELYFKGLYHHPETHRESLTLAHTPGRGYIHLGQHRHGAHQIMGGERINLIIWGRNNAHRMAAEAAAHQHHHHDHDHDHHHDHGHHDHNGH